MTEDRDERTSWAADVAQEVRHYYADGRAARYNPRVRLLDVAVRDGRFWVATRNDDYARPLGLVRRVAMMATGFTPALDPASAAEILVGEVATPPEPERLTDLDGVGWWGEVPDLPR